MSEAKKGASPLEALCHQVTALTQAVKKLQEGYFQLEDHLQNLSVSAATADQNPPIATIASTSSALEHSAVTPTVVLPPQERRVPVPERFSGDQINIRALKVGFIISLLSEEP